MTYIGCIFKQAPDLQAARIGRLNRLNLICRLQPVRFVVSSRASLLSLLLVVRQVAAEVGLSEELAAAELAECRRLLAAARSAQRQRPALDDKVRL